MQSFFALTEDRQNTIINGALTVFGKMGYKKASASLIAETSEISKSMVFHYFGTKKKLYLFLAKFTFNLIFTKFLENRNANATDFFDRIVAGTAIKINVMKQHPAIMQFLTSMYFETNNEVKSEITKFLKDGESFRDNFVFSDLDISKFKPSIDPELVLKILIKFSEGYVSTIPENNLFDLDKMTNDFSSCMLMLKNNFYKEEFL